MEQVLIGLVVLILEHEERASARFQSFLFPQTLEKNGQKIIREIVAKYKLNGSEHTL